MSTFTDGNGVNVSQLYRRCVHRNGDALGGGCRTLYIIGVDQCRGHHAVFSSGIGLNGNAAFRLLGVPNVGDRAISAVCIRSNGQCGLLAFANGGRASDVAQNNCRCVYGNGNALGGRGGARYIVVINRGGDYHAVSGSGFRVNADACTIAIFDGLFASAPYIRELAVCAVSNGTNGEGGTLSTFTDGNGVNVSQLYRRCVHRNGDALGGGCRTLYIIGVDQCRGHHAVFSSGIGLNGNAAFRLLGVPNVGDRAISAVCIRSNGQCGLLAFANGGRASDVAQNNCRCVYGNIECFGVGGRAIVLCRSGHYRIGGVDFRTHLNGVGIFAVNAADGRIASRPCVGDIAVGLVSNRGDGQCGAVALANGADTGDVAEGDRRSDDGQGHAHDTVATVGGGIFHQFGAGLCENGVGTVRIIMVGELVVAAGHLHLVSDGRRLRDGNTCCCSTPHVVGHRHAVVTCGESCDAGDILARLLVAPYIYIWCSLHARRNLAVSGHASVVATVAGHMRGSGGEMDDIVLLRLCNGDVARNGSAAVGIGHRKSITAFRQTAHSDVGSHLFHHDGLTIILPVFDGLDAIGRFAPRNVYHGITSTGLLTNGGVVPAFTDGGGEFRIQTYPYVLGGVKPIVACVAIVGFVSEKLHGLLPIPLAFIVSSPPARFWIAGCRP